MSVYLHTLPHVAFALWLLRSPRQRLPCFGWRSPGDGWLAMGTSWRLPDAAWQVMAGARSSLKGGWQVSRRQRDTC